MNSTLLAAAVAPDDLKSLVLELKDILHRLDVIERDIYWHQAIALGVIAFFGIGTIGAFWKLWKSVEKKIHDEIEARANQANDLLKTAKAEIADLKRSVGTKLHIESGEIAFKFGAPPHNYASHTVRFKTKFPQVPQVYVTEGNAGEWVYMKVDACEIDRFTWAARTLSGAPSNPNRDVRLQWVAIHTEVLSMDKPEALPQPAPA